MTTTAPLDPLKLYRPKEVADLLDVSENYVREYARAKHQHRRAGRKAIRFNAGDIELLIEHMRAGQPLHGAIEVQSSSSPADDCAQHLPDAPAADVADWHSLRSRAARPEEVA